MVPGAALAGGFELLAVLLLLPTFWRRVGLTALIVFGPLLIVGGLAAMNAAGL